MKTNKENWVDRINRVPRAQWKLLGIGGFGKVFQVKETDGTIVAIKMVGGFGTLQYYKKGIESIKREYDILINLENPRIMKVFGFVLDEERVEAYLIMEFMESGSLQQMLDEKQKLEDSTALKILHQILEGIAFLHDLDLYHSDIKPANILLKKNGDAVLSDFGISVSKQTVTRATGADIKGDVHYCCPEILHGKPRGAANDCWSIGATLVHMVTGKVLNHTQNMLTAISMIGNYDILYDGQPLQQALEKMPPNYFVRVILSNTLCKPEARASPRDLLQICELNQSKVYFDQGVYIYIHWF